MANAFLKKLFGDSSTRELKKIQPKVQAVEALEQEYAALSDQELKNKTREFKDRYQKGESLDDLLPEAFAACREAAWRVLGMKPYRVQIIGGIVLHQGRIAEMKTGEGKTLVATMPAYLNALTGRGVHIVTVNDYLAKRDSDWMGKVYRFMGLTCGTILHDMSSQERREAYACDITYGTNNELGFDYLRDNMAIYKRDMVQRGHVFAIVDEVDSILIDEARTPLIISGQGDKSTDLYKQADSFVRTLTPLKVIEVDAKESQDDIQADYIIDEKGKTATITPRGVTKAEKYFNVENLTDPENTTLMHHINQAIKAHGCMHQDVDYVVRDGQIVIVDEFTGRLMFGRRYNEGLHQAIEAKEGVTVLRESKTLATITFQNFFRLYEKLSGMTGTALTEEDEFREIYKLDVIEIPTNRPLARKDLPDAVYKTEQGKFRAVIRKIVECHEKGQPVLVGTISIEKSEELSRLLKREGIKHQVLNAKYHEKEAAIVAQAGKPYAVTIATNMAGRGTDIMLGGNPEAMAREDLVKAQIPEEVISEATGYADTQDEEVLQARAQYAQSLEKHKAATQKDAEIVRQAGGLCILGTERHESRRIDNQLRGRSGRQGDPGESRFYISLEDDLMRLFGSDRLTGMLDKLGLDEDTPIDQKFLSNAIESAQSKVEGRNFQSRKYTLEYDDVMNRQREIIYDQRRKVLDGEDLKGNILSMIDDSIARSVARVAGEHKYLDTWQAEELVKRWEKIFLAPGELQYTREELDRLSPQDIQEQLEEKAHAFYAKKEADLGSDVMRELERVVLLKVVDTHWMDHIDAMHELRRGIGLQAYAQHDPIVEYKRQGFDMFDEMINEIKDDTARMIFIARIMGQSAPQREQLMKPTATSGDGTLTRQPVRKNKKPGRNDPCPCGSGLKYKKCCGKND
ncbi:preprotein translocase subunit SecA [Intestinimonas butyriciproducens]|uniref:preprotein translocase subunit SecA n=1 Tax=Intestinimonas butyriciproducens TaxID=1297617 RepID=UPI00195C0070|nr:preprotein translocase subunit SecA [Intestinimonas butyriciproducens]MBM6917202.1 preprotein translocase subunit SecA [Intestinimonas butyriciproducens]